ncbi:ABC transporter permease [Nitratireductor sp. CAU 1489]|uniref:ABC transporter permease n=1 Tax=Nitratireductor arenosus TaxID=2682096 RepID=A0A844QFC6_9HYPH|nr:ABC transporter permease [Nitratireductor arenosus]MVA98666.1 ABC transporter permease [Nitratireductor arenosus]
MTTFDGGQAVPGDLLDEFLAAPYGNHGPALRRLLLKLRSLSAEGKHVLVEIEPFRQWRLARLRGRGQPVELLDEVFDTLEDAERHVFRLRCAMLESGAAS